MERKTNRRYDLIQHVHELLAPRFRSWACDEAKAHCCLTRNRVWVLSSGRGSDSPEILASRGHKGATHVLGILLLRSCLRTALIWNETTFTISTTFAEILFVIVIKWSHLIANIINDRTGNVWYCWGGCAWLFCGWVCVMFLLNFISTTSRQRCNDGVWISFNFNAKTLVNAKILNVKHKTVQHFHVKHSPNFQFKTVLVLKIK